jgi:hypothetical protein
VGFGPSNCFLWASSAFKLFGARLRSLELSSSGQQCLQVIQDWALVPRIIFFGPVVPSNYSSLGFSPSNHLFRASNASALFEFGPRSLESLFRAINTQNTQILVATYQFGCRMSNTKVSPRFATPDGPVFVSSALCREIFHTYGMKLHRWMHRAPHNELGFDLVSPTRLRSGSASPRGFESGDSNLSKLTECLYGYAIN